VRCRRYANDPVTELTNAAVEQMKITELRLRKTFGGGGDSAEAAGSVQAERRAGQILAHLVPPSVPGGSAGIGPRPGMLYFALTCFSG
jgi:hypothetical protein